jgi:hypothetical protein
MTRPKDVNYALTEKVNHFNDSGLTFSIGQEIKPEYADLVTVLKFLYTGGYTKSLQLVQTAIDHDLLFTGGTKEQYQALVPQIVNRMEFLVQSNMFDVYAQENYRIVVCVYVLSWYWFHYLAGPKPRVRGLKEIDYTRKIVQNEPLQCPVCYQKFIPPSSFQSQQAKMWSYIRWLPSHCVSYHKYNPPKALRSLITKEALKSLDTFNNWYKTHKKGGTK